MTINQTAKAVGARADWATQSLVLCLFVLLFAFATSRADARGGEFSNPERLMAWVDDYRSSPEPAMLPEAVHAMKSLGLLRDTEKSAFFTGFIAGVLADNPHQARSLAAMLFPMPAKEQGVIIRAIAYSGLPDWEDMLSDFAPRMPHRRLLIDQFLSGDEKTLMNTPLDSGPETIYTLWGYYVATGYHPPVARIILALRWSTDRSEKNWLDHVKGAMPWNSVKKDIERLGIGATAKWTLASYAERHRDLLDFYRGQLIYQPPMIAIQLNDVIEAAETFESDSIRKQELAAIEEAKIEAMRKEQQPSSTASAGSIAIATGCVIATATGHPEIGIPCVVTGALYNGAVKMFQSAD